MTPHQSNNLNPVLRIILIGSLDPRSPLSKLPVVLLKEIVSLLRGLWQCHIDRQISASINLVGQVQFPKPSGINVNMTPIILGSLGSVPPSLLGYASLIESCPVNAAEWGSVGYLTIHESVTSDLESQRRPGLHTEGGYTLPGGDNAAWIPQSDQPLTVWWGRGFVAFDGTIGQFTGGLFMASSVGGSSRVWNCRIADHAGAIGPHGDIEHLRGVLGAGAVLKAGELVWITDLTPHESLPLPAGTPRSFFRLVTSQVSVWYADHSTPNPLGVVPGRDVRIVHGNKFQLDAASVE